MINTHNVTIISSGTGISSVGIYHHDFVTREMTPGMKYTDNELHEILCSNRHDSNLAGVNLIKAFNHCTVLVYYASGKSKDK